MTLEPVPDRSVQGRGAVVGQAALAGSTALGLLFRKLCTARWSRLRLLWALASAAGERWAGASRPAGRARGVRVRGRAGVGGSGGYAIYGV